MAVSLCRLHVSNFFGGRAGFDVDASHILPQGVLAAITLVGGMATFQGRKHIVSHLHYYFLFVRVYQSWRKISPDQKSKTVNKYSEVKL